MKNELGVSNTAGTKGLGVEEEVGGHNGMNRGTGGLNPNPPSIRTRSGYTRLITCPALHGCMDAWMHGCMDAWHRRVQWFIYVFIFILCLY